MRRNLHVNISRRVLCLGTTIHLKGAVYLTPFTMCPVYIFMCSLARTGKWSTCPRLCYFLLLLRVSRIQRRACRRNECLPSSLGLRVRKNASCRFFPPVVWSSYFIGSYSAVFKQQLLLVCCSFMICFVVIKANITNNFFNVLEYFAECPYVRWFKTRDTFFCKIEFKNLRM